MCFSATASLVTGLVGLCTARLACGWSVRFAAFWAVVSSMQFVELAIHLTQDSCAADSRLALTLHLLLLSSLLAQSLVYAWFVAERSADAARLLYVHWAVSMLLRAVAIAGYLREGVTHDLFVPGLMPERTDLCVGLGSGGHLAWNHGFINAKFPFLPHYADLLLGLGVPALVYQPGHAVFWGALIGASRIVARSQKEGGSVWCVMVHAQLFVEGAKWVGRWRRRRARVKEE
tara:strand:- start:1282 stop:1977 length:696 start_codon:yes stop_codon:yes gene_type:complete